MAAIVGIVARRIAGRTYAEIPGTAVSVLITSIAKIEGLAKCRATVLL